MKVLTSIALVFLFFGQKELLAEPCSLVKFDTTFQDSLVLYNVISPNGDGQNDVLAFDFLDEFEEKEIKIIDQWGGTVYQNKSYDNSWGGDRNGNPVPAGNYRYFLRLDGKIYSSNLTIIYN